MREESVFSKTGRGIQVVKTREIKLDIRSRTILLAVDGVKTLGQLEKVYGGLFGDLSPIVNQLIELGLIEELRPEQEHAIEFEGRKLTPAQFAQSRRYLAQFVDNALGKDAGTLEQRIARAESIDELTAVIDVCRDIVLQIAGKRKAEAFVVELKKVVFPTD